MKHFKSIFAFLALLLILFGFSCRNTAQPDPEPGYEESISGKYTFFLRYLPEEDVRREVLKADAGYIKTINGINPDEKEKVSVNSSNTIRPSDQSWNKKVLEKSCVL